MFHVYVVNEAFEMVAECLVENYKAAQMLADSLDKIYGRENVCLELVLDDTEKVSK